MVREQQIIVRSEPDDLAARFTQRRIAIRIAEVGGLRQIKEANARIAVTGHDIFSARSAAVANDKQFEVFDRLHQDRRNREPNNVGSRMRRHQDRNEWPTYHPFAFPKL